MGDQDTAVSTPQPGEGNQQAAGSPEPGEGVGTGEKMVPEARLNGLMATMNTEQEARKEAERKLAEYEAGTAPEPPAGEVVTPPVAPGVDDLRKVVDEAAGQTRAVFTMYRDAEVKRLLREYPFAKPSDITGNESAAWEESARTAHEHVKSIVEKESSEAKKAAEEEARRRYGAPPGIGSGGGPGPKGQNEVTEEALKAAVDRKDTAEAARLTLLLGVTGPERE